MQTEASGFAGRRPAAGKDRTRMELVKNIFLTCGNRIPGIPVRKTAGFLKPGISERTRQDGALREMILLMLPMILSNILQQFYNTVDALVIGRFADQEAFAAVGIASAVMNLFTFLIAGACSGISVIFSQYYGQKNMAAFRNEHFLTAIFGTAGSVLLAAGGILLLNPLLRLMRVDAALLPYVRSYLSIVLAGLPAVFLYNLYSAMLRSIGRTSAILLILFVSVGCNLALDLLLVRDLSLGIRGAAAATAAAEGLSALLGILYGVLFERQILFRRGDIRLNGARLKATWSMAFVTGLHHSGLYIGKLGVQAVVNTAGISAVAAYTASTRIEGFANSFGDSATEAESVLTAQRFGAGDERGIRRMSRASFCTTVFLGITCSVLLFLTAGPASAFLLGNSGEASVRACADYLRVVSLFYLFDFTGSTYAGYFNGIGRVRIPFLGAAMHITLRVILSVLLVPHFGLPAVAAATGIGWVYANLFWLLIKKKVRTREAVSSCRRKLP